MRSCGGTRYAHARVGRRKMWLISERPIHRDDCHLPNYHTRHGSHYCGIKAICRTQKDPQYLTYSDNALELVKAAYVRGVEHRASLPGEPKTNSLIERTNQIIVGGTFALLICAGLPPCYWSFAAPCFCVNYNIILPENPTSEFLQHIGQCYGTLPSPSNMTFQRSCV